MRGSKEWIVDSVVPRSVPSFPSVEKLERGIGEGGWVDGFLVQWIPDPSDRVRKEREAGLMVS